MKIDNYSDTITTYQSLLSSITKELSKLYPSIRQVISISYSKDENDIHILYENSRYEPDLIIIPRQTDLSLWVQHQLEEKEYEKRYKEVVNYMDELRGRIPKQFSERRKEELIEMLDAVHQQLGIYNY